MLDLIAIHAGDPKVPAKCLQLINFIKVHGYDFAMNWALAHGYSPQTIQSVIAACKLK